MDIDIASIEYGRHDDGRRTALVTFAVTTDARPLPTPQDFSVQVVAWDAGNPNDTVGDVKAAFHRLMRSLAEQTAAWDQKHP